MSKKIPVTLSLNSFPSTKAKKIHLDSLEERCFAKSNGVTSKLRLILENNTQLFDVIFGSYEKTKKGFKVLLKDKENQHFKLILKKEDVNLKKVKTIKVNIPKECH